MQFVYEDGTWRCEGSTRRYLLWYLLTGLLCTACMSDNGRLCLHTKDVMQDRRPGEGGSRYRDRVSAWLQVRTSAAFGSRRGNLYLVGLQGWAVGERQGQGAVLETGTWAASPGDLPPTRGARLLGDM